MRFLRGASVVGVLVLAATARPGWAQQQSVSEPALKAAFLFNFAKFTEWPADALAPGAPLRLCLTDAAVADALDATVTGRSITGHPVTTSRVSVPRSAADDSLSGCAVAYVTGLDAKKAADVLGSIQTAAVFSVSDFADFAAMGGVANFLVEGDRMRFALNPAAAERVRLRLNSQLLAVARLTKDRPR